MVTIPMEEGLSILSTSPLPSRNHRLPAIRDGGAPEGHLGWPQGFPPLPRQHPCRELARWSDGLGFY